MNGSAEWVGSWELQVNLIIRELEGKGRGISISEDQEEVYVVQTRMS